MRGGDGVVVLGPWFPALVLRAIGERFDATGHPARQVIRPWDSFHLAEVGVEKVIARRATMEVRAGMTANLGFGISAMVPRILLEEGQAEAVTWAIEQGAVGGMPLTGFAFGCAANADA